MGATFFGDSREPLFGFYHPARGKSRDVGVLLCGPAPQEYMRTHWAFRKLAEMLARTGFHAFRFDYYGTGDSAGATGAGSLETWRANVATAAQELRDVASVKKIVAVGFRLGALLAASSGVSFHELVLWEPVVRGDRYLGELEGVQKALWWKNPAPPFQRGERPEELLGFPLPRPLEASIRALDLSKLPPPKSFRTTVMVSQKNAMVDELTRSWSSAGSAVNLEEVPDEVADAGELQAALLSNTMLNAIVARLT